jgi:hypothetical protein
MCTCAPCRLKSFASVNSPIRARNKRNPVLVSPRVSVTLEAYGSQPPERAHITKQSPLFITRRASRYLWECFPRNHVHFSAMASQQAYRKQRALKEKRDCCRSSHTLLCLPHRGSVGFAGGFAGAPALSSFYSFQPFFYPPEDTDHALEKQAFGCVAYGYHKTAR